MSSVFISYRRQTAAGEARALFNDLVARLGPSAVFMDVDSISLGRDFRRELQRTLAVCDVMLVLIDNEWAVSKDDSGRVRLENAGDFVRLEVEAALQRDIVVTPVLIKGARMPVAGELPAEISDLAYRAAFELSHSRWESDVREMVRRLKLDIPEQDGQVGRTRSEFSENLSSEEIPPLPINAPPAKYAGWLTRRRLLTATTATAIAGTLGGSSYWLLNRNDKKGLINSQKAEPIVQTKEMPIVPVQGGPIAAIKSIAVQSAISGYSWQSRGIAPAGYIKGMALVYARVFRKFKAGNAAALDMAQANTGDVANDALAFYDDIFASAGMSNSVSGADTLRHLFVLLVGLGMRESSGRYCQGRDLSVDVTTADTADAGMFSASYSIRNASPLMTSVFNSYSTCPSGFEDVFTEGLQCSARDFKAAGNGDGEGFQWLSKECPAFAAEVAAVGLRHIRGHWGPINQRKAQVVPECDAMLSQVQAFVDASPAAKLDAALL